MPILFSYISQVIGPKKKTPVLKNVKKKAVRQCIKIPKPFQYWETYCLGTCPCNFLSIPN